MPYSSAINSRRNASFDRPNKAISQQLLAPHTTAAKAMNRISHNSCRALAARGSANLRKSFLNLRIGLASQIASPPQNPGCAETQQPPQIDMRFPCRERGGWLRA